MRFSTAVVLFIGIIAVTNALPVDNEHAIVPETEFEQASPASVARAKAMGASADKAAEAAGAQEAKWTAQENSYAKKAAELNKEDRGLQEQAAKDNAAAAKKAAEDAADAMKKVEEADAASAAAAAHSLDLQKQYAELQRDLAKQGHAAKKATHERMATLKAEMAANTKKSTELKELGKTIQASMKKEAENLKTTKEDIESTFKAKSAQLKDEEKAKKNELLKEQKASEDAFAKEFKSNADKFAAAKAAIAAQAVQNKKEADAAQAKINKKYAKKKTAMDAANKAWDEKAALDAKALKATRAATKAKFEKMAAEADEEYKKQMAAAGRATAAAVHAGKMYEKALKDSKIEDAKVAKITAENEKKDSEIKACAMDGSECQKPDGKCAKVNKKKGPWVAEDLVSCTDTKPKDQAFAGESWAHIPKPLPLKKFHPSPKCIELHKKFAAGPYGGSLTMGKIGTSKFPLVNVACAKGITGPKEHKQAFEDLFDFFAACPPYCLKGTATTDGLAADTHGVCIDPADMAGFKMQITDLPVYKAMGTNDKIPAGPPADLCRMAKSFAAGILGGSVEGNTPAPTPTPTKAVTKKPLATGPWAIDKNAGVPLPPNAAQVTANSPAGSGSGSGSGAAVPVALYEVYRKIATNAYKNAMSEQVVDGELYKP
jgi:colicin import membrane protein